MCNGCARINAAARYRPFVAVRNFDARRGACRAGLVSRCRLQAHAADPEGVLAMFPQQRQHMVSCMAMTCQAHVPVADHAWSGCVALRVRSEAVQTAHRSCFNLLCCDCPGHQPSTEEAIAHVNSSDHSALLCRKTSRARMRCPARTLKR